MMTSTSTHWDPLPGLRAASYGTKRKNLVLLLKFFLFTDRIKIVRGGFPLITFHVRVTSTADGISLRLPLVDKFHCLA